MNSFKFLNFESPFWDLDIRILNFQAIIPMNGSQPGDPHTLETSWTNGSMGWSGWQDIYGLQKLCYDAGPPEGDNREGIMI